jgi:hypothetical protein
MLPVAVDNQPFSAQSGSDESARRVPAEVKQFREICQQILKQDAGVAAAMTAIVCLLQLIQLLCYKVPAVHATPTLSAARQKRV